MPAIFGDHMVLQQNGTVPVWGWAAPGEAITVSLGRGSVKTVADAQGKWRVDLPPLLPTATPQTLAVTGRNRLIFSDVLVGDVWLCAGQSNMEYGIGNDVRGGEAIAKSTDPLLRLFTIPSNATTTELEDFAPNGRNAPKDLVQGKWQVCTPEMLKLNGAWNGFSAVGYYFGRGIRELTRQPVGLIASTRGGTKITPWISLSGLKKPPAFEDYLKEYERKSTQPNGGGSLGPGIPSLPTSIYNATIAPLKPYAIRGVVWYQGESNSVRAAEYADLLPRLIADWREKWGRGDFPFLLVQLAGFDSRPQENYALLRESQFKALAAPNTGLATAVDLGNPRDVHPRDKFDVGQRLLLVARHLVYGEKGLVFSGPVFQAARSEAGGRVRLSFQSVGGGLVIGVPPPDSQMRRGPQPAAELAGFAMAGADKVWAPAKARIEGATVLVWSEQVPQPVAIRYAWANAPEANLFNREGLPALPFRTDTWPEADALPTNLASAAAATGDPASLPLTARPSDANSKAHADWLRQCADRVAAAQGKPVDIIFIGDSITQNFVENPRPGWNLVGRSVWDKYYADRHALNFGVGADGTQHVLWRLDTMNIRSFRPKVAVILVGINNAAETATDIAAGVKAVIAKTRETFPGVKVISLAILPNGRAPEKTAQANEIIRTFADDKDVFFLDLSPRMKPLGPGRWEGIGGDKLHVTPEGYQIWASAMEPLLARLLGPK